MIFWKARSPRHWRSDGLRDRCCSGKRQAVPDGTRPGLTPAQFSTGGKTILSGISKRGNNYVRRLLIHGARSCVMHLDRTRDRLGLWIDALQSRMHHNKVVVALANKLARIAWVVLTKPGTTYERHDPQFAAQTA